MLFNKVTKDHILQAIKDFESKGLPNGYGPSSTYDLVYEGKTYPPKAIMAYANYRAEGRTIESYFKGGLGTDCFETFRRNGFEVVKKGTNVMNKKLYTLKQEFLTTWPIERLEHMTLQEYTNLEKTSFCYWIEQITRDLGSVAGGSSYKFGIYKRSGNSDVKEESNRTTDGEYAWFKKYGDSRIIAFNTVKSIILEIVKSVQSNKLEEIDDIDLGYSYKWKIAFLYGNYNTLNIFKSEALQIIAKELEVSNYRRMPTSILNECILKLKSNSQDYFNYTAELWKLSNIKLEGIKEKFSEWLKSSEGSNKVNSYIRAIDLLSETLEKNIFLEADELYLKELYEDLIKEQRNKQGIYFYEKAPSYGNNGFYSAAIKAFIEFLNRKNEMGNNIDKLINEYVKYLSGYADLTIDIYSMNFQNVLKKYRKENQSKFLNQADYISLSEIKMWKYEKWTSYGHQGKGYGCFKSFFKEKTQITESKNNSALNQILYGPPGTGKTYNTINKALGIIDSSFLLENLNERKQLTNRFKQLRKSEQIIFTTFHQSMSYEDFVEGIKPVIDDSTNEKQITYEVVSGIFKSSCAQAAYNCYLASKKGVNNKDNYTFDTLYEAFLNYYNDAEPKPYFESITGKPTEIFEINKNDSIRARAKDSIARHVAPLTKENLQKMYDSFNSVEEINNLKQIKETIGVSPRLTEFYAIFKGIKDFEANQFGDYNAEIKDEDEISIDLETSQIIKKFDEGVFNQAVNNFGDEAEPIVLIIDEINRGNVSQIFGELITLIEKDKRMGNSEALEVKLPYSKKEFGVPPNLYIIGTMNTADRSVEALDTALRRRFTFEELMPNYDLIDDIEINEIKLSLVLQTINERIEILIDRDHTIGHSYFINIENEEDLANTFNDKIVPLLQEYFYGDYGKIGLVLGNGFVKTNKNTTIKFAQFTYESASDFIKEKQILINQNEGTIMESIKLLLNKSEE